MSSGIRDSHRPLMTTLVLLVLFMAVPGYGQPEFELDLIDELGFGKHQIEEQYVQYGAPRKGSSTTTPSFDSVSANLAAYDTRHLVRKDAFVTGIEGQLKANVNRDEIDDDAKAREIFKQNRAERESALVSRMRSRGPKRTNRSPSEVSEEHLSHSEKLHQFSNILVD
eukprot:PhF_6_TR4046/c0_g2_i1/m.5542